MYRNRNQTLAYAAEAGGYAWSCAGHEAKLGFRINWKSRMIDLVKPGSPAAAAGLLVGDVILEVDRKKVTHGDDAVRFLRMERDSGHVVHVLRGTSTLDLTIGGTP